MAATQEVHGFGGDALLLTNSNQLARPLSGILETAAWRGLPAKENCLRPFVDLGVFAFEVKMETQDNDQIRNQVRTAYAKVANGAGGCSVGCCGTAGSGSLAMGYSADELAGAPEGADLGLGCGNPQAIAALRPGETVLDLGSGGGFDSFLAAKRIGRTGKVIGVDMTPEMVTKARGNARKVEATNVEFRLGEIEHLPVADGSIDVILSNCVINLSPDKHHRQGAATRSIPTRELERRRSRRCPGGGGR